MINANLELKTAITRTLTQDGMPTKAEQVVKVVVLRYVYCVVVAGRRARFVSKYKVTMMLIEVVAEFGKKRRAEAAKNPAIAYPDSQMLHSPVVILEGSRKNQVGFVTAIREKEMLVRFDDGQVNSYYSFQTKIGNTLAA